ncbi:MAG: ankyrin repeat domain-containing protein [Puniceicoccales bacterium]|nr:ankyrin repeat domain-containing protein [Puniceicoccales bacterium]
MKNKYIKKTLIGMIFLPSVLHHNVVQASYLLKVLRTQRPSSVGVSWNNLDKGRVGWRYPTQLDYTHWFHKKTPSWVSRRLSEAVCNKQPSTVLQILLLIRICHHFNNQNDLNYLLHIAVQNNDFLSLAALLTARYRDELGIERALFDINYEFHGRTPVILAIQYNRIEMAHLIAREGADLFRRSNNGTILHFALQAGNSSFAMETIQRLNDQYLPNGNQQPNGGQPQKRKQFLNEANNHGETIFHVACRKFLQGELSPALLLAILFWFDDYDFKNSPKQEQIFEDLKEILMKLLNDEKWYKFLKNFKINEKTRKDLIQAIQKALDHICDAV